MRAVDLFVYRVEREIGSLAAAVGGLDTLVFTAGIGEHAPAIRQRICEAAEWLGVALDNELNAKSEELVSARIPSSMCLSFQSTRNAELLNFEAIRVPRRQGKD